jgi:excisionase family DNA binding protein
VTVRQAAKRLEVSPQLVYALIAAGKLSCVRIGLGRGTIRILDQHIADYLSKSESVAKTLPAPPPKREIRLKHLKQA